MVVLISSSLFSPTFPSCRFARTTPFPYELLLLSQDDIRIPRMKLLSEVETISYQPFSVTGTARFPLPCILPDTARVRFGGTLLTANAESHVHRSLPLVVEP